MVLHPEFGLVDSPANPEEMILLPGVGEAIAELNRLGLLVIVVSNQPGIAKGKFTRELLEAMSAKMLAEIEAAGGKVDGLYHCLHHPEAIVPEFRVRCDCRKPKAGLLLQAARERDIDLTRSYMVGDGVSDVAAGQAARTTTVFVSSQKCYICDSLAEHGAWPDYMVKDLAQAVAVIGMLEAGNLASAAAYGSKCQLQETTGDGRS